MTLLHVEHNVCSAVLLAGDTDVLFVMLQAAKKATGVHGWCVKVCILKRKTWDLQPIGLQR